jgi:centrosomal protein CEP135
MVDVIANNRYQELKARLDSLHYCQPFTIESCALVERLLSELLKMTVAYKRSQNELNVSQAENRLNQQSLAPLQKENERLTKENNQLHSEIITAREEKESVDLKWKAANRQL